MVISIGLARTLDKGDPERGRFAHPEGRHGLVLGGDRAAVGRLGLHPQPYPK